MLKQTLNTSGDVLSRKMIFNNQLANFPDPDPDPPVDPPTDPDEDEGGPVKPPPGGGPGKYD